jgi:hypothetical protein
MAEANPVTIQQTAHSGVRASDFVGRTEGKLRDHYRIGKVLGTGKLVSQPAFQLISTYFLS